MGKKKKYKFVFIASKAGDEFGRAVKRSTLKAARATSAEYRSNGWKVSRISKTTKV